MLYRTNEDLPEVVRNALPPHAQEVFREAFNRAYDESQNPDEGVLMSDREENARHAAWEAIKNHYQLADDGTWRPKKP